MTNPFHPYLNIAVSGRPLTEEEMARAIDLLLEGEVSDVCAAAFLAALRARGETIEEITAAAQAMRARATPVETTQQVVDTCGTGGDGGGTYNISTAAALVAAGAGVFIAKHGNKAASSKSGSSDVLAALGVNLKATPRQISKCINNAGLGFMFAAAHHKAVANVANVRSAMGVRTLFNFLGPLTNPAGSQHQLMGVYEKEKVEPLAHVLKKLGAKSAWVVHGEDGLDEITTTGKTYVAALKDHSVQTFTIAPEDVGLPRADASELKGGDPVENAAAIKDILAGKKNAFRNIVVFNAAAAIHIADPKKPLSACVKAAQLSIDQGNAKMALEKLIQYSNSEA